MVYDILYKYRLCAMCEVTLKYLVLVDSETFPTPKTLLLIILLCVF
jgi:hypothetical protein